MWEEIAEQAIQAAYFLFMRNKTSGSSANLSFLCDGNMYITRSGSCFGNLRKEDFSELSMTGQWMKGEKPSKEWPAHLLIYQYRKDVNAVIHTHGRSSVLWSFADDLDSDDCIPKHTPYLEMKVGRVGLVPYHLPGSKELFAALEERIKDNEAKAYLLRQHGAIVGGSSVMDAFYSLEELEESCAIALERNNVFFRHLKKTSSMKG